jgi:hypothetical protein
MDDMFELTYLPEERMIKINFPEEVLNSIDTIIITKRFEKEAEIVLERKSKTPIEHWTGDEKEIICPTCKNYICYPEDIETIDLKYKQFCGACGQKLNWESEVEEE